MERELEATVSGELDPPAFSGVHLSALLSQRSPAKVLDFGGGLGPAFFRAKRAVSNLIQWWRVVELPDLVAYGQEMHLDARLTFHQTITEALGDETPDIIMCSGVLQLMDDPYPVLTEMFSLGASSIVLGHLPLEPTERFAVFHAVSGGCVAWRILSREKLDAAASSYRLLYQEKLPRHPTADAASDEYCLLYVNN